MPSFCVILGIEYMASTHALSCLHVSLDVDIEFVVVLWHVFLTRIKLSVH
jgi:hypothetical protein